MNGPYNPVVGVAQVALGRPEGLQRFRGTVQAFLTSLAPLIAFPLAGALVELVRVGPVPALELIALTLVAQLAPPVLSHALATRWGREQLWLHYATAYNWCYWALPVVGLALMIVFGFAAGAGLAETAAAKGVIVSLGAYSLWLHWFLARHALQLGVGKAVLMVVLVNVGTLILAFGPGLLG